MMEKVIKAAVDRGASDLHIKAGDVFRARINGDAAGYTGAEEIFRRLGVPFWLAVALLEHGKLTSDGSLLAEAREIFQRLEAAPWLDRVNEVESGAAPSPTASYG